jgi:hypothetical protein
LHEGLQAKLTAVINNPTDTSGRLVLRAYQTNVMLQEQASNQPVYAISIMWESLAGKPWLYALPKSVVAKAEDTQDVLSRLAAGPGAEMVAQHTEVSPPLAILMAKQ